MGRARDCTGLRPDPGGDYPDVANHLAPQAHPPARNIERLSPGKQENGTTSDATTEKMNGVAMLQNPGILSVSELTSSAWREGAVRITPKRITECWPARPAFQLFEEAALRLPRNAL
jgi:hypothetical protein